MPSPGGCLTKAARDYEEKRPCNDLGVLEMHKGNYMGVIECTKGGVIHRGNDVVYLFKTRLVSIIALLYTYGSLNNAKSGIAWPRIYHRLLRYPLCHRWRLYFYAVFHHILALSSIAYRCCAIDIHTHALVLLGSLLPRLGVQICLEPFVAARLRNCR